MTTYKATVTREGKWWMVAIPELNGLTQARRLAEAEDMAREWIAVTLDLELDEVSVKVEIHDVAGIDVAAVLEDIEERRRELAWKENLVRSVTNDLARRLAGAGVPVRDIGTILGVSFQRAHQLVTAD